MVHQMKHNDESGVNDFNWSLNNDMFPFKKYDNQMVFLQFFFSFFWNIIGTNSWEKPISFTFLFTGGVLQKALITSTV